MDAGGPFKTSNCSMEMEPTEVVVGMECPRIRGQGEKSECEVGKRIWEGRKGCGWDVLA